MLQNYFPQAREPKLPKSHFLWDEYLDRQLEVLVLEHKFDFNQIASSLNRLLVQQEKNAIEEGRKELVPDALVNTRKLLKISPEICQEQWTLLHQRRKIQLKELAPSSDDISRQKAEKFNHLMKCLASGEDPRKNLSLDELIETLPPTRTNKDFLQVSIEELQTVTVTGLTGELIKPSGKKIK